MIRIEYARTPVAILLCVFTIAAAGDGGPVLAPTRSCPS